MVTKKTIAVGTDGDLVFAAGKMGYVWGRSAVAQKIGYRLNLFKGEWPLDITQRVDYRGSVFQKSPNLTVVAAVIKTEVLDVEGVIGIRSYQQQVTTDRRLLVSFVAETEEGDLEVVAEQLEVSAWAWTLSFPGLGRYSPMYGGCDGVWAR